MSPDELIRMAVGDDAVGEAHTHGFTPDLPSRAERITRWLLRLRCLFWGHKYPSAEERRSSVVWRCADCKEPLRR